FYDGLPSGEANGWALSALARAFGRDVVPPDQREQYLDRLDVLQFAIDAQQARTAPAREFSRGWALFACPKDPAEANVCVTVMVSQGLLALRAAGLGWHGSPEVRDRLLVSALRWLIDRFDGERWAATGFRSDDRVNGLSLCVLDLLFRAEAQGL